MEEAHRREIGRRIRELRERSPFKQHQMADFLNQQLRTYQRLEQRGTVEFERAEEIAKIHWDSWAKHDPEWGFVSAGWIWDGKDRRKSPDVLGQLDGGAIAYLKRIEDRQLVLQERQAEIQDGIIEILNHVDAGFALLDVSAVGQESDRAESQDARESASRDRSQTAR